MELGDRVMNSAVMDVAERLGAQESIALSQVPDVVWLSVSEGLGRLDRPMLAALRKQSNVARWHYQLDPDEPACLDAAMKLLDRYWLGWPKLQDAYMLLR